MSLLTSCIPSGSSEHPFSGCGDTTFQWAVQTSFSSVSCQDSEERGKPGRQHTHGSLDGRAQGVSILRVTAQDFLPEVTMSPHLRFLLAFLDKRMSLRPRRLHLCTRKAQADESMPRTPIQPGIRKGFRQCLVYSQPPGQRLRVTHDVDIYQHLIRFSQVRATMQIVCGLLDNERRIFGFAGPERRGSPLLSSDRTSPSLGYKSFAMLEVMSDSLLVLIGADQN